MSESEILSLLAISKDVAKEVITLLNNKSEYDIAKKDWGFYVTPSIQNRLKKFNLEAILVYKSKNYFLCLVKKNKKKFFKSYLSKEKLKSRYIPKLTDCDKFLGNLVFAVS